MQIDFLKQYQERKNRETSLIALQDFGRGRMQRPWTCRGRRGVGWTSRGVAWRGGDIHVPAAAPPQHAAPRCLLALLTGNKPGGFSQVALASSAATLPETIRNKMWKIVTGSRNRMMNKITANILTRR